MSDPILIKFMYPSGGANIKATVKQTPAKKICEQIPMALFQKSLSFILSTASGFAQEMVLNTEFLCRINICTFNVFVKFSADAQLIDLMY